MTAGRRSPCLVACCAAGSLLLCSQHAVLSFGNNPLFKSTSGLSVRRQAPGSCSSSRRPARGRSSLARAAGEGGEGGAVEVMGGLETLVLERPIDRVVLDPGRGLRIHCLSDLHTDYKTNLAWVKTWPSWKGSETHEDVLLVAGDVSSSLDRSAETLSGLKELYDQVFFVVGNHDLWAVRRGQAAKEGVEQREDDGGSVEKLVQVHRACERLGVRMNPAVFVLGGEEGAVEREATGVAGAGEEAVAAREEVGVFPLLSWYHASWDDEPDLPPEDQFRNGDFFRRWGDYVYCRWPAELCSREDFVTVARDAPPVLANFFARQNDACIEAFRAKGDGDSGREATSSTVISFSHFVPRQELCPEKRFLSEPNLTKAIGSAPLERQIRELGSDLHVFGHTHIPIDMGCDGVRYLQWPLGSVMEQSRQCKKMREQGPLLVYSHDGQKGGLTPPVQTFWGDHYVTHPRDTAETFVPEWALKRIRGRRKAKAPPSVDPLASE